MNTVDMVVLGVLVLSGLVAFMRGIVREVLSLAAWGGAAAVAATSEPLVRPYVSPHVPSQDWTDPVCYVLVFLAAMIVFSVAAKMISSAVKASAIGGIDRTLGLAFGLGRGALVLVAVYIAAGMAMPVEHWPEQVLESRALPFIRDGANWTVDKIPSEYRPAVPQLPPGLPSGREPSRDKIIATTPTGRASDPPPRK